MLFSQFPPPSTSSLDNGGAHSRPSRLRRLSNLRNYRSAVAGAVSTGNLARGSTSNSGSSSISSSANPTTTRPAPDLHLTRSLTNTTTAASSKPQANNNNNQGLSPSSSALSTGSSSSQPSQTQQQHLAVGEHGDGNPLTQVNSAPNFATTSGVAVASNVNGSNPTSSAVSIASNPPADALQTTGETASISSQGRSDAAPPSTTPFETPTPAPATTTTTTTDAAAAAASAPAPAEPATMTRPRSSTTGEAATAAESATAPPTAATFLPSIRLSAYYDPRSTRPSLSFPPITRTLPSGTETIRVGRYSERDSQSTTQNQGLQPSAAPVGFKSKVVSRRHCEFWYENGKWYIKDVKSSSGTFLNHIRLSPPSQESKAFPVNDGDIVQLGIDFKGGEEMIFRCVKMRLELNRGWQNKLNTFNVAAHQRLRTMSKETQGATSGSSDCSICLNSIAPCQSLFVAPCSHTWHFKCVRSLLTSPQYPIFICPNCRAGADLEADVEDPAEGWGEMDAPVDGPAAAPEAEAKAAAPIINTPPSSDDHSEPEAGDPMDMTTVNLSASELPQTLGNITHAISEPLPIRSPASGAGRAPTEADHSTAPLGPNREGPITPRNNAGPWVFDGRPGDSDGRANGIQSLDAAADMDVNQLSSDASSR